MDKKVSELRSELRRLGLATDGRKADLVSRLESFQQRRKRSLPPSAADPYNTSSSMSSSSSKRAKAGVKHLLEESFKEFSNASGEEIGYEEMGALCSFLGVSEEDPVLISLSFVMRARTLGIFTREEFFHGLTSLSCSSLLQVKETKLDYLRSLLSPTSNPHFFEMYKFVYDWACEPDQKSMAKETAIQLWPVLLRELKFPYLKEFVEFVENSKAKGVPKDLWIQFWHFAKTFTSLQEHDTENGAWPVAIDEWVEAERLKRKHAAEQDVAMKD